VRRRGLSRRVGSRNRDEDEEEPGRGPAAFCFSFLIRIDGTRARTRLSAWQLARVHGRPCGSARARAGTGPRDRDRVFETAVSGAERAGAEPRSASGLLQKARRPQAGQPIWAGIHRPSGPAWRERVAGRVSVVEKSVKEKVHMISLSYCLLLKKAIALVQFIFIN
jgi:hypothetical protein